MPYGYNNQILEVDLTNQSWSVKEIGENNMRKYMGGEGFVAHTLLNEIPAGADPLGPENVLVFSTGILTGAPVGGSGRHAVGAKSPLTGGFGEAEAGGFWGPELKRAGWDAIVIKGKSQEPVYLSIMDDAVELRSASHLTGKTTADAEKVIRDEMGDKRVRVAQIGPAGEALSRIACVIFDHNRAAGRTGLGAVMGSKKLRAVAVRGKKKNEFAEKDIIIKVAKWLGTNVNELMGGFKEHGTAASVLHQHESNSLPTLNFKFGQFEGAEKIDGTTMTRTLLKKRDTCFSCPVNCKRVVEASGEIEVNPEYGGPEFETLGAFGSMCGVDDLVIVCKANELCNMYGLDTISAGVTIAFAMECFEEGLLTIDDTGGIELSFGNGKAMLDILKMMIWREGIGDLLAEGAYRAAESIGKGAMDFVMHVKKQELPEQEPRAMHGLGLGYAVSPTGADHMHNMYDMMYASKESPPLKAMHTFGILEPLHIHSLDYKKVRLFMVSTNWRHMQNCIGICMFMPFSNEQHRDLINGITGWNTSLYELLKVGERAVTLARLFNAREGIKPEDDRIPDRLTNDLTSDHISHKGIDPATLEKAVKIYYGMMGWDDKIGLPTRGKLLELDLPWAIKIMEGLSL